MVSNLRNAFINSIEIYSITGQTVRSINNISATQISVDIADLDKEIYVIKVGDEYNKRIIIK